MGQTCDGPEVGQVSWQLGLVERELNEVLQGCNTVQQQVRIKQRQHDQVEIQTFDGRTLVEQREIAEGDVCPICQEELLVKKLPVTFCKFGCGNSIHIKCMQVWAEHQQKSTQDGLIKCPMCREDFGPIDLLKTEMRNAGCSKPPAPGLRLDRHVGITCANCNMSPIEGKCYRCSVCPTYFMCQKCFNLPVHTNHSFQFRQKCNQKWKSALRTLGSSLPPALVNDLMRREITDNDYDMLLQLERNSENTELSNLTESSLQALPLEKVREGGPLLALGSQCRICLRGFSVGQLVRKLPCKHKFHKDCIDSWLLHSHPTCPIDGLSVAPTVVNERVTQTSGDNLDCQHYDNSSNLDGLILNAYSIPLAESGASESAANKFNIKRPTVYKNHITPLPSVQLQLLGTKFSTASINNSERSIQESSHLNKKNTDSRSIDISLARRDEEKDFLSEIDTNQQLITGRHLINFLQAHSAGNDIRFSNFRRLSANSLTSVHSDGERKYSLDERGQHRRLGAMKRRPQSSERSGPSIQDIRQVQGDLYLGNSPVLQPPVTENVAVRKQQVHVPMRTRLFKPGVWKRLPPLDTSLAHTVSDMKLKGNAFDYSSTDHQD
ncbi:E3 ubiquitin-protein ligase Zswim2 [Bulinus truncatus]|nr:E3 ubiquitin-protein ligase Zswim2 [Bulinus truncatus]